MGKTQCPKCRAWNPEGCSACVQCGTAMPADPSAALTEVPGAGGGPVVAKPIPVLRAVLVLSLVCALAILVWLVLPLRQPPLPRPVCLSNVKNITLAFQMYLADNDYVFPPAGEWCDTIREYVKNDQVYRCPEAGGVPSGYAYNVSLDALPLDAVARPAATIVVFESDKGWNAVGGPELLPKEPRHSGGDYYGCADGNAHWASRETVVSGDPGLRWEP